MDMQSNPVIAGMSFTPLLMQQIAVSVVGVAALITVVVLFVRIRRRIALDKARASIQADADVALRGLRSRLNYAAQLLNSERDRMVYDRVRFSDEDAKKIATLIQQAEHLYQATQATLDRTIRRLPEAPTATEYHTLIEIVKDLTPTIPPIEATLQQSIKQRSELESLIQKNNDLIEQVQREQQKIEHRLATLGINHRELLATGDRDLARAHEFLASHQYADATTHAQQAQQIYQTVAMHITTLYDVRNGVTAGRQAAEKATLQGFDVNHSLSLFQEATRLLDLALADILIGNLPAGNALVSQAEALRQQAVTEGGSLPIIQQRQNEAIAQTTRDGEVLTAQFAAATTAFQSMKNMHPATWHDLINAGSEAVVLARFGAHYVAWANRVNTPQQYTNVSQLLSNAQAAIQRAGTILQIIVQRHADLQRMELIARQEFSDAEELMEIVQARINGGDSDVSHNYPTIKAEFLAVQQAIDEIPFDCVVSYRKARQFIQHTYKFLPHNNGNTPLLIAERSQRIRDMLWRQIRLIEQFHTLHPVPEATSLLQGLQSIRHEANTFDVTWHTASDMTVPIISELTRLIQRYDRLDNAMSHIDQQLRQAWQNQLPREEALFGALSSAAQRIRATNDESIRTAAIQRLYEIDSDYAASRITISKAINLIHTMSEALPNDNFGTQSHIIDPVPFLQMRRWAKIGPFAPPLQPLTWVPAHLPTSSEW